MLSFTCRKQYNYRRAIKEARCFFLLLLNTAHTRKMLTFGFNKHNCPIIRFTLIWINIMPFCLLYNLYSIQSSFDGGFIWENETKDTTKKLTFSWIENRLQCGQKQARQWSDYEYQINKFFTDSYHKVILNTCALN